MADPATVKNNEGREAFVAKKYDEAIRLFSEAIILDPMGQIPHSNRSAAWASKKEWVAALEDAKMCISINPGWSKGYVRKGAALHGARRYDEAIVAYEAGLKLDPGSDALKRGLKMVQDAKKATHSTQMPQSAQQNTRAGALENLRKRWLTLDKSSESDFTQDLRVGGWRLDDVTDVLVPKGENLPERIMVTKDTVALEHWGYPAEPQYLFAVEKAKEMKPARLPKVLLTDTMVEGVPMQRQIQHLGGSIPWSDAFRMTNLGVVLNFVVVTKTGKTVVAEYDPHAYGRRGKATEPAPSGRMVLKTEAEYFYDEVPGQYHDFLLITIGHLHFVDGWLKVDTPPYKTESLRVQYWLRLIIDALRSECQIVFPEEERGRKCFPHAWTSRALGGVTTWRDFLCLQPVLKMWLDLLMTTDDAWEFATIDQSQTVRQRCDNIMNLGKRAATRLLGTNSAEDAAMNHVEGQVEDIVLDANRSSSTMASSDKPDSSLPPRLRASKRRRSGKFDD